MPFGWNIYPCEKTFIPIIPGPCFLAMGKKLLIKDFFIFLSAALMGQRTVYYNGGGFYWKVVGHESIVRAT